MREIKRRRTEITIERVSVTTIRKRNSSQQVLCDRCQQEIESDELQPAPFELTDKQHSIDEIADTADDSDSA